MPIGRVRIRSGGSSSSSSGSSSGSGSGKSRGRSGPHADEHTHTGPAYGHRGSAGAHSVYTTDRPREDPVCHADLKVFVDCINTTPHHIALCQRPFDAFIKCTDRRSWWAKYREYLEL